MDRRNYLLLSCMSESVWMWLKCEPCICSVTEDPHQTLTRRDIFLEYECWVFVFGRYLRCLRLMHTMHEFTSEGVSETCRFLCDGWRQIFKKRYNSLMVKISPQRLLENQSSLRYLIAYCRSSSVNVSTANVFEANTSFFELTRHALDVTMFHLFAGFCCSLSFEVQTGVMPLGWQCECDESPDIRYSFQPLNAIELHPRFICRWNVK